MSYRYDGTIGRRMERRKGKALRVGDTIGIVAPASPVRDLQDLIIGKQKLESLGFNVTVAPGCYKTSGDYLAGEPLGRVQDLHDMFQNHSVDAIMCLRGGYGTPQLLPLLDYGLIAENPKLLIGYSDITALQVALWQKAGLPAIHGPMLATDLARNMSNFSLMSLIGLANGESGLGERQNPRGEAIETLVSGIAKGRLVGGNLSMITATMGTPYEIETRGSILFLEDVGEPAYRVDRMLTQLALAGKLAGAAGFIIGTWTDRHKMTGDSSQTGRHRHNANESTELNRKYCVTASDQCKDDRNTSLSDGCITVMDVIKNRIAPYRKPTIYNVRAGHSEPMVSLPLGVNVTVDATERKWMVEESVTTYD